MVQADGVVANGTGSAVRTDINNQYAALWSNHSGSTEPSSGKVAFQTWADTNSGYLKIRNAANNAWIQLFKLDGTDICRLTGSTNNTVCTVTSANNIQGESNVQIDSSGRLLLGAGSISLPKGSAAGSFDLDNGNITMCIGGNSNSTGRTNSTDKVNRITSPHYTNAEEPVALLSSFNESGNNTISYGGGSGQTNAVTKHSFYTAANTTTTNGTERFVIDSSGNVTINDGDLVIGTAGHGIDFSANSHATGMTSELLDGYEEGSHTATITIGSGTITTTHSSTLTYTKIGRVVHVVGRLYHTFSQSNVTTWQTSLPFASISGGNAVESGSVVGVFRADAVSGEAPDGMRRIRVESGNSFANMVFNTTSNGGDFGQTNPHIIFNLTYYAS